MRSLRTTVAFVVLMACVAVISSAATPSSDAAAGPALTLSRSPGAHALYPRDPATNRATVAVAGTAAGAADSFRADLTRDSDGALISSVAAGGPSFSLSLQLPAGLESYTVSLYVIAGRTATLHASWPDLVAGDAFVVSGQSNAAAAKRFDRDPRNPADTSNSSAPDRSRWIRTFGSSTDDPAGSAADGGWRQADGDAYQAPGAVGQYALRLGRRIVDTYGIPVALLNGAHDAQPIGFFQRDDADPRDPDTNYGRLLDRAARAGLQDRIRGILWYQGESDNEDAVAQSTGFARLLAGWRTDYTGAEHIYVHQIRNGCLSWFRKLLPAYAEREAQRRYADTLGVTVLSTNGIDGQGPDRCHYYYAGGYATLADHDFLAIARDYYGGSPVATEAPNPRAAWFANPARTEITIALRNATDAIRADPGVAKNFLVNDRRVGMTVTARPGFLTLHLKKPVAALVVNVSYVGHPGAGPWVANANRIGLLSFYRLPVGVV
ncbi:sialate O-acetylesterase [Paractinoplanes durhamensis]|uniref:Sialate O-acetylesterase domain-containing protein n=1 Tax=Paractinoplanes durhamensis TaxID=113563 RepID=A0ABQ3YRD9_9ACTN|nr:sialate O-acetylesterase [Actinoplanes durhamensis]GIE00155.1 hypothetical protein Adu01nite_15050 [Actinoplanes durhamensis]